MTEKQKILIDGLINALPEEKETFREIAEYAVSLGYLPNKLSKDGTYIAFSKSKVSRTIMKVMALYNECIDAHGVPCLYLNFYATKKYSELFQRGVRKVIEHFGGVYLTECNGCGKCDGIGYPDPDGKGRIKCGNELVELPPISFENVAEIKSLLKAQDEYFVQHFSK